MWTSSRGDLARFACIHIVHTFRSCYGTYSSLESDAVCIYSYCRAPVAEDVDKVDEVDEVDEVDGDCARVFRLR